jgi:hypothetical protein
MKKILLLLFMFGLSIALRAQSLTPFVVSTSGAFFSNGAGMLSTTIGELAAVTTLTGGSNILTQGFQQPWDFSTSIPEIHNDGMAFDIYPNPSSGNFTLALNTNSDSKVSVKVYDVLGKTVYFQTANHLSGFETYTVNLDKMAEGMYLLEVRSEEISSGKISVNTRKLNLSY